MKEGSRAQGSIFRLHPFSGFLVGLMGFLNHLGVSRVQGEQKTSEAVPPAAAANGFR